MSTIRRLALARRTAGLSLTIAVALLLACRPTPAPGPPARPVPAGAPRLVLFLVADQMPADYLVRFRPLLEHGLGRLLDESVVYTDAHQDHAATVTATGHATLSTGTFPSHHGIVGNSWFSREEGEEVTSVEDPEHGSSPHFLLRPTIGDLMKEAWPSAKVFGVSAKSRSAIFSSGKNADAAFWYDDETGEWVTSTYYEAASAEADEPKKKPARARESGASDADAAGDGDEPPASWRDAFHERKLLDPLFGTTWEPLLPLAEVERYGVLRLNRGWFATGFPYAIGGFSVEPDEDFYTAVGDTPFLDGYTAEFAKALIDGEGLGADEVPDFLGVSFSMLDIVGHGFGPDAPETLDTLMRLDLAIGELLDFVDQRIGLENVVVTLSSDHGVGRVPELLRALGQDAGRFGAEQVQCAQRAGLEISRQFGLRGSAWLPGLVYLDREVLSSRQVDPDRLLEALAGKLAACPRIARVVHPSELREDSSDEILGKLARGYYAERSPDLEIVLAENTLSTSSLVASHGSPYRYDTHVPLVLRLPGVGARRIDEKARTVDLAPTLAEILGIADLPDARFDGTSRLAQAREAAVTPATATASGAGR